MFWIDSEKARTVTSRLRCDRQRHDRHGHCRHGPILSSEKPTHESFRVRVAGDLHTLSTIMIVNRQCFWQLANGRSRLPAGAQSSGGEADRNLRAQMLNCLGCRPWPFGLQTVAVVRSRRQPYDFPRLVAPCIAERFSQPQERQPPFR